MPRVAVSDRTIAGVLALGLGLGWGLAATVPAVAQPVVQPLPSSDSRTLNAALARVAANPRDSGALVDAGNAALGMNDVDAAIGFFTRAEQVAPGDARAKAGLAGAYVRNEDPFTAIRLFDEAERAGPLPSGVLADRGLAYDLVGDNATAQRYYREAGPGNEEAVRRLALSLAISGDKRGSEAALSPLLARQDKSAWRTRAFSLAILGDEAQAVQIANGTMPATLAASMAPYLKYMRQLTRAQQAAAANLGHFPRASEIGRDDPRMAAYAPPTPRRPATGADAGLVPTGEPLGSPSGSNSSSARGRDAQQAARASRQERERLARQAREDRQARSSRAERERPPEPVVAVTTTAPPPAALTAAPRPAASAPPPRPAAPAQSAPAPGFALAPTATSASASTAPLAASQPTPVASAPPAPASSPPTASPLAAPSFSLAPGNAPPSAAAAAPAPRPSPPPAPPPRRRSLAEAFGDFSQPATITPSAGAVDIRRITPNRPPEAKPAKPLPPAQPSRIWVQVATGRNKQALGFDWRRMAKDAAAVFRGKKPHVTAWGQTNRLLTGPFETEAAANAFIAQLRRADVDGAFLWTSPAGQVVDELAAGK